MTVAMERRDPPVRQLRLEPQGVKGRSPTLQGRGLAGFLVGKGHRTVVKLI